MMEKNIVEKELSYTLVGIFFDVQNELGRFSRERQYGDAIAQKLQERGIEFEREWFFEVGGRKSNIVDFLIRGCVVIEIKAKPLLERQDFHQAQRYLETSGKELAFLVNFRDKFLKPRRILNARMYKPTMPNAPKERNVFVDSDRFVDSGRSTGFTVVELLVAMGVFTALLSFAVGVFIQGMRSQRELTDQITVNNEMSLVLEQMAREMRTGSFFAGSDENYTILSFGPSSHLQFEDEEGDPVVYKLVEAVGTDGLSENYIARNDIRFTGRDVSVDELKFFVSRSELCSPWRVTMLMKVRPRFSEREPMPIQTTISSRVLPVDLKRDENPQDGLNDFAVCRQHLVTEREL